jgi:hypothetical protein
VAVKKSAKKVARRKIVARKRATPKRAKRAAKRPQRPTQVPATETVVVDTIEQPATGVVVVTETEYALRRDKR